MHLSSINAKAVTITVAYQDNSLSLQVLSQEVHYVMSQSSALKLFTELSFLLELQPYSSGSFISLRKSTSSSKSNEPGLMFHTRAYTPRDNSEHYHKEGSPNHNPCRTIQIRDRMKNKDAAHSIPLLQPWGRRHLVVGAEICIPVEYSLYSTSTIIIQESHTGSRQIFLLVLCYPARSRRSNHPSCHMPLLITLMCILCISRPEFNANGSP